MADITHSTWINDGKAVDAVYQSGIKVYGRNLIKNTSETVVQASNWNLEVASFDYSSSFGSSVCASVQIDNSNHAEVLHQGSANIYLMAYDADGKSISGDNGNQISYDADGQSICHFSFPQGTVTFKVFVLTNGMWANTYYSCLKLETGAVNTAYSKAPEDILN